MASSDDIFFSTGVDDHNPPSHGDLTFIDELLNEMRSINPDNVDITSTDTNQLDSVYEKLSAGQSGTTEIHGIPSSLQNQFDSLQINEENRTRNSIPPLTNNNQVVQTNEEKIDGLDQAMAQLFCEDFPSSSETLTTSPEESVVKSDFTVRSNLVNSTETIATHQILRFRTPPFLNQRARYASDHNIFFRYISAPDNNRISFHALQLRDGLAPDISVVMRVTRTTNPYESVTICHPYPLWVNDPKAQVHQGSLLLDITKEIRNNEEISFENLMMVRLGQSPLKEMTQWPIFTTNQLDYNDFHQTGITDPKILIEKYRLHDSILHFQIFVVDTNHVAYPTDLLCETESIFEYEEKDRLQIPNYLPAARRRQPKRLQRQTSRKKRVN
ncbi:unnamed protein product [Adineta ricciae]|uniref:Uncharacterized protein n=1 Tax=Adineta ricciae TaxID=249248 RepID=A0A814W238_ADIRI|nr:unnamed protein product [Adineta ricciae]